jgi:hypothetical protein
MNFAGPPMPLDPVARCRSYFAALNSYDIPGALACLSADFRAYFPAVGVSLTREDLPAALGWDVATNGQFSYNPLEASESEVSGVLSEANEFYRLLGLEPAIARATFRFDAIGLIREQVYEPRSGSRLSVTDALKAPMCWARREEPEELEAIAPGGQLVYTESTGRRWIGLLARWRAAIGALTAQHASKPAGAIEKEP